VSSTLKETYPYYLANCIEAGKPIKDSRGEVSRLIDTFRIAAEESVRIDDKVRHNFRTRTIRREHRGNEAPTENRVCDIISGDDCTLDFVVVVYHYTQSAIQ
jgi:hypothetical protein